MDYLNEDVLEYTLRKLKSDVLDDKMNVADIEDSVSATSSNPVKSSGIYTYVTNSVENKVDKVKDKGLSTNDFTTTYKNQLDKMNDFDGSYDSLTGKPIIESIVTETSDNTVKSSGIYNYVNSSISTNTAYFRGTFNSVSELNAYTGDKTLNDYAFVRTTDSAGNTLYNRYKWNNTSWVFEYALNNSSFTANQWTTINSGLTSADKITIESALSSTSENPVQNKVIKAELDNRLSTKVDKYTSTNGNVLLQNASTQIYGDTGSIYRVYLVTIIYTDGKYWIGYYIFKKGLSPSSIVISKSNEVTVVDNVHGTVVASRTDGSSLSPQYTVIALS